MIKDLVVGFRQAQQQFPSIVQDNYKLKEGIYIRLNLEQTWAEQSAAFEENHLIIRVKEDAPQNAELLGWFKRRDSYSSLISMNKPVDTKKQVHSNNPFSLFVKREVFLGEKQDSKTTLSENIDRYLLATDAEQVRQKWLELIPSVKKSSGKVKRQEKPDQELSGLPDGLDFFQGSNYAESLTYLISSERLQWIKRIVLWYQNSLAELTDYITQLPFKNYVKIFFDINILDTNKSPSSEQLYAFEYLLYTIPKIYNSNVYNQIVREELMGLPSFDMTMNSKKPFLEHKTMRIEVPDRVSLQQAILAKEATEWLATRPKYATNRLGYESGFAPPRGDLLEGTFHVYMDGKYNELFGFENVPFPPTLHFKVDWLNSLQLKDREGDLKSYGRIDDAEVLQKAISGKFFRGRMNGSFILNTPPDVKNKEFTAIMVALYLQSRQAFHDWFYKGTIISLRPIFSKVTLRLLVEQLIHVETSRMTDLADAFNLRLSIESLIEEEGGKRKMADRIEKTVALLRDKLNGEGMAVCSNDDEFYFMAGQLAYYLMKQSKAEKKTGEIYEPFLRAKNGQHLKRRLEDAYMLYKHEISSNYRKFNHAFSMVMGYVPEQGNEGSSRELLLAGLFADNLLFEKSVKGVE